MRTPSVKYFEFKTVLLGHLRVRKYNAGDWYKKNIFLPIVKGNIN